MPRPGSESYQRQCGPLHKDVNRFLLTTPGGQTSDEGSYPLTVRDSGEGENPLGLPGAVPQGSHPDEGSSLRKKPLPISDGTYGQQVRDNIQTGRKV
ncbi:hypothetical protein Ddye_021309 [Dipteronia dyeriana]|uniref:Uncharacterized protein n=1 Tax=Dipteronia dyeriana TaxID=168575 RepID=A0AAD9U2G6_9ROSI|nr:hypothetical protein Ddye_021309 [Dipteronia dyeriana]